MDLAVVVQWVQLASSVQRDTHFPRAFQTTQIELPVSDVVAAAALAVVVAVAAAAAVQTVVMVHQAVAALCHIQFPDQYAPGNRRLASKNHRYPVPQ